MAGKNQRDWGGASERQFIRLLDQGHSISAIARVMKCARGSLAKHYAELIEASKHGRLEEVWTSEQRGMVQAMAGFGLNHEQIATVMGISPAALNTYFLEELRTGEPLANAQVAGALFHQATKLHNTQAAVFWLGARAGWKKEVHVAGKVEHDHQHQVEAGPELRGALQRLDPNGRAHLESALGQLGAPSALDDEPAGEGEAVH